MGEVGGPFVSQAEGITEGSLVEAEAMVSYGKGCELAGGTLFTCQLFCPLK